MTTETRSAAESRNQVAGFLMIGGALLIAAAAVTELVYKGTASSHEAHRNLGDIARAVIPGANVFLLGGIFLINRTDIEGVAPESLPWLQRPRVRRGLAYAYFALGGALILFNLMF